MGNNGAVIKTNTFNKTLDIMGGTDSKTNKRNLYLGADNIYIKPKAVIDMKDSSIINPNTIKMAKDKMISLDNA